ncbi:hypothetical protein B0H12DRAFT_1330694, partial [Mycena haematopus]
MARSHRSSQSPPPHPPSRQHTARRPSRSRSRHRSSSPSRSSSLSRQSSSRAPHHTSSPHGRDMDPAIDYKAAYKALEASNRIRDVAEKKRKRGASYDPGALGAARGIRLLAALFGDIPNIVAEAETYLVDGRLEEPEYDEFSPDLTEEETEYLHKRRECERNLTAYQEIIHLVPALGKRLLSEADDLIHFYTAIQKAANDSRSECLSKITRGLGSWINEDRDRPDVAEFDHTPAIIDVQGKTIRQYAPGLSDTRVNRGPDHDICGGLLTSLEQDWDDTDTRTSIRDSGQLSTSFFCRIFYANFRGDPNACDKGFLKSRYLVKAYKIVFTGPSSVKDNAENEPPHKKQRESKAPVRKPPCDIFLMKGKVTPRSVAFVCVLVHMSLTNAQHWMPLIYGFSYPQLYDFVVDYLETPRAGTPEKADVDKLMTWWNEQIFPHHASSTGSARTAVNSMAALRAQRQRRAGPETLPEADQKHSLLDRNTDVLLRWIDVVTRTANAASKDIVFIMRHLTLEEQGPIIPPEFRTLDKLYSHYSMLMDAAIRSHL